MSQRGNKEQRADLAFDQEQDEYLLSTPAVFWLLRGLARNKPLPGGDLVLRMHLAEVHEAASATRP